MWEHLQAGQHRASPHPTNPITPTTTPNESTGHPGPGAAWSFPRLGTVSGCRVTTSLDACFASRRGTNEGSFCRVSEPYESGKSINIYQNLNEKWNFSLDKEVLRHFAGFGGKISKERSFIFRRHLHARLQEAAVLCTLAPGGAAHGQHDTAVTPRVSPRHTRASTELQRWSCPVTRGGSFLHHALRAVLFQRSLLKNALLASRGSAAVWMERRS